MNSDQFEKGKNENNRASYVSQRVFQSIRPTFRQFTRAVPQAVDIVELRSKGGRVFGARLLNQFVSRLFDRVQLRRSIRKFSFESLGKKLVAY